MILHNPFAVIKHLGDHVKLDLPIILEGSEFVEFIHASICHCHQHLLGYSPLSVKIIKLHTF